MKRPDDINAPGVFIDIGQSSLKAVNDGELFDFPLERGENGRLTDLCRERLTSGLRGFLGKNGGATGRVAWCAIGARGVSLRRMTLPGASGDEFQRVLRLQIESEFPLSPDELAWGWRPVGSPTPAVNGAPARQEVLVVAVKKDVVQEYAAILNAGGAVPQFTLAALARAEIRPAPQGRCAVLDIGRTHSELMTFDNGVPLSIRLLAWGGETITTAIAEKLAIAHDEAEKLKLSLNHPGAASAPHGAALQGATESALSGLASLLKSSLPEGTIYVTGKSARDPGLAALLSRALGNSVPCESLELDPEAGVKITAGTTAPAHPFPPRSKSAAIAGLMKSTGRSSAAQPLLLQLNGSQVPVKTTRTLVWKWAAAAAALALGALLFPYAEAVVMKPILEKKLAALKSDRSRLGYIDAELDFLKFVKQTNLPCLDVIYLLAKDSPAGAHLDALSMGRHQEVSLRLKLNSADQVTEVCKKLVESGWLTNIIVEEQTPGGQGGGMFGGQGVNIRMTADLMPVEYRKPIPNDPADKKTPKSQPAVFEPMAAMPSSEPTMAVPAALSDSPDTPPPPRRGRGRGAATPPPDLSPEL